MSYPRKGCFKCGNGKLATSYLHLPTKLITLLSTTATTKTSLHLVSNEHARVFFLVS